MKREAASHEAGLSHLDDPTLFAATSEDANLLVMTANRRLRDLMSYLPSFFDVFITYQVYKLKSAGVSVRKTRFRTEKQSLISLKYWPSLATHLCHFLGKFRIPRQNVIVY